jgi:hypothetical protein
MPFLLTHGRKKRNRHQILDWAKIPAARHFSGDCIAQPESELLGEKSTAAEVEGVMRPSDCTHKNIPKRNENICIQKCVYNFS